MNKWEYKIMEIHIHYMQEVLNDEGSEGWELVTAYKMRSAFYPENDCTDHYCIFKRPYSETQNDIL